MNLQLDPRMVISNATQPSLDVKARKLESLKESTKEFEAIYLMEAMKAMRKSIPEGGLFKKTAATETWQEMLDMQTVRQGVETQGLGLAEEMYRQLAPLIENAKE